MRASIPAARSTRLHVRKLACLRTGATSVRKRALATRLPLPALQRKNFLSCLPCADSPRLFALQQFLLSLLKTSRSFAHETIVLFEVTSTPPLKITGVLQEYRFSFMSLRVRLKAVIPINSSMPGSSCTRATSWKRGTTNVAKAGSGLGRTLFLLLLLPG